MIKLLEKKVLLKCRESDIDMVRELIDEMQDEYASVMKENTDSDDYQCEIEILEDEFIKPESKEGKCGGVVISSTNKLIVCSNSLTDRLHLCYEESLPVLRQMLFPKGS